MILNKTLKEQLKSRTWSIQSIGLILGINFLLFVGFKIDWYQCSSINVETFSNWSAFNRSKGRSGSEDEEKDGRRLSEVGRVEGEDGKRLSEDGWEEEEDGRRLLEVGYEIGENFWQEQFVRFRLRSVRDKAGLVCPSTSLEYPSTGLEYPSTGLECPSTGLECPSTGLCRVFISPWSRLTYPRSGLDRVQISSCKQEQEFSSILDKNIF